MAKKNANNAIDFARLFAVKDQVARQSEPSDAAVRLEDVSPVATTVSAEVEPGVTVSTEECDRGGEGVSPRADVEAPRADVEAPRADVEAPRATVLAFRPAIATEPETVIQRSSNHSGSGQDELLSAADERDILLRIGMTRELHARLRACAALEGKSPTSFARDVLEADTPVFDTSAPLAQLVGVARGKIPVGASGPRRIEMRMQVPATDLLHRRLLQFAALRGQTLVAALIDLLDAHVPTM